jgi:alpha-glucosidase/alpha-D-xyloside xylohydrolase
VKKNRLGLPQESLIKITYTQNPFGFAVTRISNNEVLFNSTPSAGSAGGVHSFNSMVFKDQYLEISTQIPASATLFGLGESTRPDGLPLAKGRTYTLWATDIGAMNANVDLYGAYPYYMDVREGGLTHGVLLLNSNGMDIHYGKDYLTYHVIGGSLDFYFFAGPTPMDVVDQYTNLVGRPAPMPYWSFGEPPVFFLSLLCNLFSGILGKRQCVFFFLVFSLGLRLDSFFLLSELQFASAYVSLELGNWLD